jgi:hypothetical protein
MIKIWDYEHDIMYTQVEEKIGSYIDWQWLFPSKKFQRFLKAH